MALTELDKTYRNSGCTKTDGSLYDRVKADFRIIIKPNSAKTGYNVDIYTRLYTITYWSWTGAGNLKVNVTWTGTDGSTKTYNGTKETSTPLQISQGSVDASNPYTTPWNGPLSFTNIPAVAAKSLTFNIDLDLLRVKCSVSGCPDYGVGLVYEHDGVRNHLEHFYLTQAINVEEIPLETAPTISNLINNNKYNSQAGISAATNSISVKWTESGNVTSRSYKVGSGSWTAASSNSITISSLAAGTSYTVYVKSTNSAGDSNTLSITIRTRYAAPSVTVTYKSKGLESLTFDWTSDKSLASSYYKIDSGNWVSIGGTGTSGSFTVSGLTPNTSYTISFYGQSTSTYDSLDSSTKTASGTTHPIASVTVDDCTFGLDLPVTISNPSGNTITLTVSASGNNLTPSYDFSVTASTTKITLDQDKLDSFYKCYTTTNTIPLSFVMKTAGTSKTYSATAVSKNLTLTGIAKTIHYGVNNADRRGQMWYGVNNVPRRAILWVGDSNNKPRRCI